MQDLFLERKKKICELLEDPRYVPMKEKELAVLMQVSPKERPELTRALNALVEEEKIVRTRRGCFVRAKEKIRTGIFSGNARGFGFVTVKDEPNDFFIPQEYVGSALHGDTVTISALPVRRGQRPEAKIVAIVNRAVTQVVGTYQEHENFGFVTPDCSQPLPDIFIPREGQKNAADGVRVVAQITDYGDGIRSPQGRITEILGFSGDPGVDVLSVVRSFELPEAFPEKTRNQAERVAKEVSSADCAGRRDLREVLMVTIDGEDARDLDDAVSLTEKDGLFYLGVHIADVANYVQENSALDWEARKRGTSVYLADRVIPMLPPALSNGICSLNEGQDRLALSCLMQIDAAGNVVSDEIVESVIRVDRRMSYSQVKRILEDRDEALIGRYRPLVPMLLQMERLSGILREKRKKRGGVDFDFPECKIELDAGGNPLAIVPYERSVATRLIEDFMLAANETVAQHFYWMEIPFLYRTHEKPDPEKMDQLSLFLCNFGYRFRGGSHPGKLQKLLEQVQGTPEEGMISRLTLRSMKRAAYTTECIGHFGLAAPYYCHFTSPIRRYPDLQIHRIIKEFLRKRLSEERMAHYRELLPEVARHSSATERRADEADREVQKMKKAQFMEAHIGEEYEGVICSVTGWGLYVELQNTVEGLIHVSSLTGDYYVYDRERCELVGERTHNRYRLGQKLRVRVAAADRIARTVDFVPVLGE